MIPKNVQMPNPNPKYKPPGTPTGGRGGNMMDYDKLIGAVKLCGSTPKVDQCKQCAYWAGGDMGRCIPKMTADAATALKALWAELSQMAACVYYKPGGLCRYGGDDPANVCVLGPCPHERTAEEVLADLARVTAERDADA